MANHKSALKRARQSVKLSASNKADKSCMRTYAKKVVTAVEDGDVATAQEALRTAISVVAVTARKGVIHKNQASRRIGRLNAKVKELVLKQAAA